MNYFSFEAKLIPPSVNNYWRANCRGKYPVFYITKSGKNFKKALSLIARSKIKKPLKRDIELEIEYHIKGKVGKDIDNILKAILDSLNGVIYEDDKQIVSLKVTKLKNQPENKLVIRGRECI